MILFKPSKPSKASRRRRYGAVALVATALALGAAAPSAGAATSPSPQLPCSWIHRCTDLHANVSPKSPASAAVVHPTVDVTPERPVSRLHYTKWTWPNSNVWNSWGRVADFGAWSGGSDLNWGWAPTVYGHCVTQSGANTIDIVLVAGGAKTPSWSGPTRWKKTFVEHCTAPGQPLQDFKIDRSQWDGHENYPGPVFLEDNHPNVRWVTPAGAVDTNNSLTIEFPRIPT